MDRFSIMKVLTLSVMLLPAAMVFAGGLAAPKAPTPDEVKRLSTARATIETKFGKIVVKFFPDKAPIHVKNFVTLAEQGFYDGTVFHRVIPGFMVQGGDPNSKSEQRASHGTGGPGYTIPAEFNDVKHVRGILSMARTRDPNSGGSQFFVMVADAPHLDGQYSVFGQVVEGMDVVDAIVALPRDGRDNPNDRVEINVTVDYESGK